jgi:hypothetical protein
MIENFFKWLELVPLSNHNKQSVAYAFLDMVLNKFRAATKILVN